MEFPDQRIDYPLFKTKQLQVYVRRLDLLPGAVTGNKYFKLKYNLEMASNERHRTLLTFGGAYSNHILATAEAGAAKGFKTIGVIRGEELEGRWKANPTLNSAAAAGMAFHFVSRSEYREKTQPHFIAQLKARFGPFYLLPEGGTNELAVQGTAEILEPGDSDFHFVACAVGTGGTLAGLVRSATENQQILGFPVLKDESLKKDICSFVSENGWKLVTDYHFGGYAAVDENLVNFINDFRSETGIPLDPVYTGKLFFGMVDLIKKDAFTPNSNLLIIHSGGLQGIRGMNQRLKEKKLPLIEL